MLAPVIGATDLPRRDGRRSGVAATLLAVLLYAVVLVAAGALVHVVGPDLVGRWRVSGTITPIGSTPGPEAD